ncbi:4-hydroxybenzoate 3-monooxygenase [Streptomyces sp. NBRC 109706]|uniref:4-hydroxybenzoate 3-monooxygenase n=1 Tax=Streptomyces sp. NBRC 109706 TaxID=1550035 RepID=UPI000783244C|nr:4-hydroxybenzoate 3-monooxygenase [Streptomyces sp. NBRC 109706]
MRTPVRHARTEVAIVGAGPAGLLAAHLLRLQGIESVVVEARSRSYILGRVRAGILEQPVVDLLHEVGLGERLARESMTHDGVQLAFEGELHRIDLAALTGRRVTVYGQQEIAKDLLAAHEAGGQRIVFEVSEVRLDELTDGPVVSYEHAGVRHELRCEVVVGADGSHGVSRSAVPDARPATRSHDIAWYGILAECAPASDELVYARHPEGFALHSMRTPRITRQYLQVPAGTSVSDLSDAEVWSRLRRRLESPRVRLAEGPIIERAVAPLRGLVMDRMRHGRLLLAGDAAHIVPPTGAKGLNLAVGDVVVLSRAVAALLRRGDATAFERYTEDALGRVWRAAHFSWWMTTMLHRIEGDAFEAGLQLARLREVTGSVAAATTFAENYTGLPFACGWEG